MMQRAINDVFDGTLHHLDLVNLTRAANAWYCFGSHCFSSTVWALPHDELLVSCWLHSTTYVILCTSLKITSARSSFQINSSS